MFIFQEGSFPVVYDDTEHHQLLFSGLQIAPPLPRDLKLAQAYQKLESLDQEIQQLSGLPFEQVVFAQQGALRVTPPSRSRTSPPHGPGADSYHTAQIHQEFAPLSRGSPNLRDLPGTSAPPAPFPHNPTLRSQQSLHSVQQILPQPQYPTYASDRSFQPPHMQQYASGWVQQPPRQPAYSQRPQMEQQRHLQQPQQPQHPQHFSQQGTGPYSRQQHPPQQQRYPPRPHQQQFQQQQQQYMQPRPQLQTQPLNVATDPTTIYMVSECSLVVRCLV